jgi:hypothetical protein
VDLAQEWGDDLGNGMRDDGREHGEVLAVRNTAEAGDASGGRGAGI